MTTHEQDAALVEWAANVASEHCRPQFANGVKHLRALAVKLWGMGVLRCKDCGETCTMLRDGRCDECCAKVYAHPAPAAGEKVVVHSGDKDDNPPAGEIRFECVKCSAEIKGEAHFGGMCLQCATSEKEHDDE